MGASTLATFATRLLGLVRNIALAWLMSPNDFGRFGLALLLINVLLPLCSLGLYEGVARFVPVYESPSRLRWYLARSGLTVVCVSLLFAGALSGFAGPLSVTFFENGSKGVPDVGTTGKGAGTLVLVVLATVFSLTIFQTILSYLKGLRMFRAVGVADLTVGVLFTCIVIVAAYMGFGTTEVIVSVYGCSCLFGVALFGPWLWRGSCRTSSLVLDEQFKMTTRLLRYSVWVGGTALLWHAISYLPAWYLLKATDTATVGAFHAARSITQLVQVAGALATSVIAAHLTHAWETKGRAQAEPLMRTMTKAAILALFFGATMIVLAKPLLMSVFPQALSVGDVAYERLVLFFHLVGVMGLLGVRANLLERPKITFMAWLVGLSTTVWVCWMSFDTLGDATTELARVDALESAASACAAGLVAAIAVTGAVLARHGVGLDVKTSLLLVGSCSVVLGWMPAIITLVIYLIVALQTDWLITGAERTVLIRLIRRRNDR